MASFLKHRGVDVRIYDCFVEGGSFLEEELRGGPRSAGGIVKRWTRHIEAGSLQATDVVHRRQLGGARARPPASPADVVGITNLFRENTEETVQAAELARRVLPDATIIIGGPNASALPDYMLGRSRAIDMKVLYVVCAHGDLVELEVPIAARQRLARVPGDGLRGTVAKETRVKGGQVAQHALGADAPRGRCP